MFKIKDEGIKDKLKFSSSPLVNKAFVEEVFKLVLSKLDRMIEKFGDKFPSPASKSLKYDVVDNIYWTSSFYTGMLWLAYELTGEKKYKDLAKTHLDSFEKRLKSRIHIDTHDLGFLYTLSCVACYKVTGDEGAKNIAIEAAKQLCTRYWEKPGIIQAWGAMDDPAQKGRIIIDCLMNLPLLYWASIQTGDKKFFEIAHKHAKRTAENIVREDASTFHTFYFDVETGKPLYGSTHQGYSDSSCWARGQAWGIYGFVLSYKYTRDWIFMDIAKKLLNYFLNRLPEDYVPYWDLVFTEGEQPRDSSAAAICICGILEMLKFIPLCDEYREYYENAVKNMVFSLSTKYLASQDLDSEGLLLHGVYNKPKNEGMDEHTIWGDYFFFESLIRLVKDWNVYW